MKKGNDLIVMSDGVAIAASKSCTIDVSCQTKEIGSKGSGDWRSYIAGRKSWEVSTSFLFGDAQKIKSLVTRTGATVTLSWGARGDDTDRMSGTAIVGSCKISGTRGNLVQGSFSFKGTGELK